MNAGQVGAAKDQIERNRRDISSNFAAEYLPGSPAFAGNGWRAKDTRRNYSSSWFSHHPPILKIHWRLS
jgi:hypothetical protein